MTTTARRTLTAAATAAALAAAGGSTLALAGGGAGTPLPQGSEPVRLDPADFSTTITNRYWPMKPGTRWVYSETEPGEPTQKVVVTVTNKTKRVANGITARVVHDVVTQKGVPVEVTDDWYAQDKAGNVWYLGEDTHEYENGKPVNAAGAWEAGVDGAQPGVIVPAKPKVGMSYRQEFYRGEAEDNGRILSLTEQAQTRKGHFEDVMLTADTTPLKPKILEYKLYAPGVGPVLTLHASGGTGREELVSFTKGR